MSWPKSTIVQSTSFHYNLNYNYNSPTRGLSPIQTSTCRALISKHQDLAPTSSRLNFCLLHPSSPPPSAHPFPLSPTRTLFSTCFDGRFLQSVAISIAIRHCTQIRRGRVQVVLHVLSSVPRRPLPLCGGQDQEDCSDRHP